MQFNIQEMRFTVSSPGQELRLALGILAAPGLLAVIASLIHWLVD